MIRSQHVESGSALLFAGILALVIFQPQLRWLFWPTVGISAAGTLGALYWLSPAERARRATAAWVAPLAFLVLAGVFAWLTPGLTRGRSLQLAGILTVIGVVLIWVRRRLT
ncbi:MAG: hypothetical protein HY944_04090 [Gemmatimonadetes bacterium]|nr:hypothetical protein [Gemmatimonadota bacterium]